MSRARPPTKDRSTRSPTAIVLVIVAVLALTQFLLIAGTVVSHLDASHILDINGAQRMRTQRIAFLLLAARTGNAPADWRAELDATIHDMLEVRAQLLARRDVQTLKLDASGETVVSRSVLTYLDAARAAERDLGDATAFAYITSHREPLVHALDWTVEARARLFQQRDVQLVSGLSLGLLCILAIIAVSWFKIVAPHERVTLALVGKLKKQNRLLAMAEQLARVGHWELDARSNSLTWSAELYRTFGRPSSFVPTLAEVVALYHPDDRAGVLATVRSAVASGTPYTSRSRIIRSDGSVRHVVSNGQPQFDAHGAIATVFGVFADVTESENAERERELLIERVNVATEAARVGIWDWDITTGTVVWDSIMHELYGLAERGFTPSYGGWLELVHPDDRAQADRELTAAASGDTALESEFRVVWPGDSVRNIRVHARIVRDRCGAPKRLIGTNWDITEVRTLAQALRQEKEHLAAAKLVAEETSRAKSDFLANMSHEIRTPMNGIIGLTSLLLEGTVTTEQREYLTLLADAGRSLLAIINDVLDLSKVEAGKVELEAIPVSAAGLVDGAVSIVRADATAKGLALTTTVASDVPAWVSGDPTRLRQILLNLLTNAIKFTRHGGVSVTVRCGVASDELHFEIADTGIGIAADRQHLLFRSFSQADRSIARNYGGTGLGLAISKRLAEAMSGTMGVASTLGTGSVFWFTARLPAIVSAPVASDPATSVLPAARRILVVDDNAINQIVAKGVLVADGHDVVLASDGAQALAAVKTSNFDLVLMDMRMPIMDGLEATRRIRMLDEPLGLIPIVALTANAMIEEIASCHEAGMNDHLAKPIDRQLLRRAIALWAAPNGFFAVAPGELPASMAGVSGDQTLT